MVNRCHHTGYFVDGASRGQGNRVDSTGQAIPGIGACAAIIYKDGKVIGQFARGLGPRTNNECEYEAVIMGLTMCWAAGLPNPIIYSDSELVVKQISGVYRCTKNQKSSLYPLLLTIRQIAEDYSFSILNVPRREVHQADALANNFLDQLCADFEKKEN